MPRPRPIHLLGAVNDGLHLLAAGFWIGGLAVLSGLAFARPAASALLPALRIFSSSGMLAVALLIVAGTVNGVLILGGSGAQLVAASIQACWRRKLVLAALMMALA